MKGLLTQWSALLVVAVLGAGCGAMATRPLEDERPTLQTQVLGAVWHSDVSDQLLTPQMADNLMAEDGILYPGSFVISIPTDGSSYVHGVISLDIPDGEVISFVSRLGFLAGTAGQAKAQIFIQDGERFPLLAETQLLADGTLETLSADLSAFRGENRMLILSITSEGQPLTTPVLWASSSLLKP